MSRAATRRAAASATLWVNTAGFVGPMSSAASAEGITSHIDRSCVEHNVPGSTPAAANTAGGTDPSPTDASPQIGVEHKMKIRAKSGQDDATTAKSGVKLNTIRARNGK